MTPRSPLSLTSAALLLGAAALSCAASGSSRGLGEGSFVQRLPSGSAVMSRVVTLASVEHGDYCHVVATPVDGAPALSMIVAHDDLGVCHDDGADSGAKRWGGDRRLRATYRTEYYCEHEPPCADDGARLAEGLVLLGLSPLR